MEGLMQLLLDRNHRETHALRDVIEHYAKAINKMNDLENRMYRIDHELMNLRKSQSDQETGDIRESNTSRDDKRKINELKDELSKCYRIISEKSESVLRLKEKTIEDQNRILELNNEIDRVEDICLQAIDQKVRLQEELDRLQNYCQQHENEMRSLREIHDAQRDKIHELTQENKMFIEQIIQLKNDHCQAINEMNQLVLALQKQAGQSQDTEFKIDQKRNSDSVEALLDDYSLQRDVAIPASTVNFFNAHSGEISSIKFDGTGRRIISGGSDKTVRIWNASDVSLTAEFSDPLKTILDVDISVNGRMCLAAGQDPSIYVWSLQQHRLLFTLAGHRGKITSAAFTSDSEHAFSCCYDRTIKYWDLEYSACTTSLSCPSSINSVSLNADGNTIGSAHLDKSIRFWSLKTGEMVHEISGIHKKSVNCIRFSRVGSLAVVSSKDSTLSVIDLRTYKVLRRLHHDDYKSNGVSWSHFGFSPDARYVAVGSMTGAIFIWNVETGVMKKILKHHNVKTTSCSWSISGFNVASSDNDGIIAIWN